MLPAFRANGEIFFVAAGKSVQKLDTTAMIMKTLLHPPERARIHILTAYWYMALLCGAMLLTPIAAQAVGFRLPNQDPDAIARGNAFAATADNPSSTYYNP